MYARIQEKGQATIPTKIRRKLNLRKGDMALSVETEAFDKIGKALKADGITLEKWNKRSREIRRQFLKDVYGLADESRRRVYS